jgi:GTP cyclohydrolase I
VRDIQNEADQRGIELDEVGIAGLRYPLAFDDGETRQDGIADVGITVRLPAQRRGTHMSRMVEIAHEQLRTLDPRTLPVTLKSAADRLDADSVALGIALPFATRVISPATGTESWQTHELRVSGQFEARAGTTVVTTVTSEVTSLCPCSKAISDYGAHNQRSVVTLTVTGSGDDPYPLSVAKAVELIRGVGSCPVYPAIKRPDERVLTMLAFDHPAFVEDIARDLSLALRQRNLGHRVDVRNIESIHSHDAVCRVTWAGDAGSPRRSGAASKGAQDVPGRGMVP